MSPNSNIVMGPSSTESCIVPAGIWTVKVKGEVPYRPAGDNGITPISALQILVKQNGSTKATYGGVSSNPAYPQEEVGGKIVLNCATSDTISIVTSSTSAADILSAKVLVSIYQGP